MENVIIDVVIGLILIYAAFSLLVTSLQELISGAMLSSRVTIMHRLLAEATGRDVELKKRLLDNPLIFALSPGEKSAREGIRLLRPPSGPSEVPPDIFARALLMELDPAGDGKPPSERYATPQQFMDALTEKGLAKPNASSRRIYGALRGLLAGNETSWSGFEAAVATWFAQIGDRADGWFKRRSTKFTIFIALPLAVLLNVDTMNIVRSLSSDGELQAGLANTASRVVAEFGNTSNATTPAMASTPDKPEVIALSRLQDAYNRLQPLYFKDDAIGGFRQGLNKVEDACVLIASNRSEKHNKDDREFPLKQRYVSDASTWLDILGILRTNIRLASDNIEKPRKQDSGGSAEEDPRTRLKSSLYCLAHVATWVSSATTISKDPAAQSAMQEAAKALEESTSALVELVRQHVPPPDAQQLFLASPEDFKDCSKRARNSRDAMNCTRERQTDISRLPLGLTDFNLRKQFCNVKIGGQDKSVSTLVSHQDIGPFGLCGNQFEGRPQIGLDPMVLNAKGILAGWMAFGLGILLTTVFAMLGAPFWFDLLGKVVRLRTAGRKADADANARKATGTLPLLPTQSGAAVSPPSAPREAGAAPARPDLNGFENSLTVREIVALQQRLGVEPATGTLDLATREKISAAQGGNPTLTPTGYLALVGRPSLASDVTTLDANNRPRLRAPFATAQALANNLMAMLDFVGRIPATEANFSDDLRALCVLYRYKDDPAMPPETRAVFDLARNKPAALDELDEALLNEILSSRIRKSPAWDRIVDCPWLDWALGELGQVEKDANNRKASNPRICEYLDAVGGKLGDSGDQIPWCGAFVTWTIVQHNLLLAGRTALPVPPANPALATNWNNWGTDVSASPQRGDVIVVRVPNSNSGGHVGWCFAVDATHVTLLGGNQSEGGRVCLSRFPITELIAARRG